MIPDNVDIRDIITLAKQAGEKTREYFHDDVKVERKKDNSPVTIADMESNKILVRELEKYGYPIFSEETGPKEYNLEGYLWIIDPLDGTNSFINGNEDHSVMLGLAYKGESVLGVVYQPASHVLYYGMRGGGAFIEKGGDTKRLQVSKVDELERAKLLVSKGALTMKPYAKLVEKVNPKEVVYMSSNGVKIGTIANAQAELFFNPSSKLGSYDYCAPHIILEEAGGIVSYLDGAPVRYDDTWGRGGIAVSNGVLHDQLLETLDEGFSS